MKRTSIAGFRTVWKAASQQNEAYAKSFELDELADEQLEIQQHCVGMMASISALSLEDVEIKLLTWFEDRFPNEIAFEDITENERLLVSALNDVRALNGIRGQVSVAA